MVDDDHAVSLSLDRVQVSRVTDPNSQLPSFRLIAILNFPSWPWYVRMCLTDPISQLPSFAYGMYISTVLAHLH